MKTKEEIEKKIAELKADERLTYPPAQIMINAPLALIQLDAKAHIHSLEWALGIPRSVFPLPKKRKK